MDQEHKLTAMVVDLKEFLWKEEEMEKVSTTLPMEQFSRELGIKEKLMVLAFAPGSTEGSTKGSGSRIKSMEMVNSHGQMAAGTKASTETIKDTVKEHIFGVTVGNTQASGKMIKGMAEGNTSSNCATADNT